MDRAARVALVIVAGTLVISGASSAAVAQGSRPRVAHAAEPVPVPHATTPYPGATVTIDPRWYRLQQFHAPIRRHQHPSRTPQVVYYPVPVGYPSYPQGGYGGGVYDTNGRPLYSGFDTPAPSQYDPPIGVPDLSGSPYVVDDGGAMVVDFGNGDRRAVPSCAAVESAATPEGQPRTIFYRPSTGGLVLHAGQSGRVIGQPTAGARVCYTVDQYGRMVLAY
jgi:hypothetical protein